MPRVLLIAFLARAPQTHRPTPIDVVVVLSWPSCDFGPPFLFRPAFNPPPPPPGCWSVLHGPPFCASRRFFSSFQVRDSLQYDFLFAPPLSGSPPLCALPLAYACGVQFLGYPSRCSALSVTTHLGQVSFDGPELIAELLPPPSASVVPRNAPLCLFPIGRGC